MNMKPFDFLLCIILTFCVGGCAQPWPEPTKREVAGLTNVFQIDPRTLSGSMPEGEESFRSLFELGVKTIISVDGAVPDVATAKKFGIQYVHLPIGYDGVSETRTIELAKAIRKLPGPVYVHCHHGKHRGPAAAIAAVRCLDHRCSSETAVRFLQTAGTDPKYVGLYQRVQAAPLEIDDRPIFLPAVADVPPLARQMVELDTVWERLKKQSTPKDATLFVEQLRELHRHSTEREEFRSMLESTLSHAVELEEAICKSAPTTLPINRISASCVRCHEQFRDPPKRRH
jgi:protein tyrosine phosphatase (PTP) superfamily phosphohydrolase (DUF442 family)